MTASCGGRLRLAIAVLTLIAGAAPALAQDGYYDSQGRWRVLDSAGNSFFANEGAIAPTGRSLDMSDDGIIRRTERRALGLEEAAPEPSPWAAFDEEKAIANDGGAPAPTADEAIASLSTYAPAKRRAVSTEDPFKRLKALREANGYLVVHSSQPPTSGTIRALDRLLGLEVVTRETTALPPAGIEVPYPEGGKDFSKKLRRFLVRYLDTRRGIAEADAGKREKIEARTEKLVAEMGVALEPAEIVGLDAFLGLLPVTPSETVTASKGTDALDGSTTPQKGISISGLPPAPSAIGYASP